MIKTMIAAMKTPMQQVIGITIQIMKTTWQITTTTMIFLVSYMIWTTYYSTRRHKRYIDQRIGDRTHRARIWRCNPLIWLKTKQLWFPTVAKLVKMYLSIPATPASSEQISNKAQRIIIGDKNRLALELAGTLFYINDNLEWYEGQTII